MMRIAVVGGGIAGTSAAFSARCFDCEAEVIIVSEEPFSLYSPCVLADYVSGEIQRDQVFLKSPADYFRYGIKTIFNERVKKIDVVNHCLKVGDSVLPYDKLIIATGSHSVIPSIKGSRLKGIFSFKNLADADEVLRWVLKGSNSAAVVGAGPIGIEVAVALRKRGLQVFLIEILDRILPRLFDGDLADLLERPLAENGVQVFKKTKVMEIFGEDTVRGVELADGRIECDLVVLCTGTKPNVELAQEAGIVVGPQGGIQVNEMLMTNMNGVYSCGDCAEISEGLSALWADARREGTVAGANAVGIMKRFTKLLNLTMISIYGVRAASVGNVLGTDRISRSDGKGGRSRYRLLNSKGKNVAAQIIEPDRDTYAVVNAVVMGDEWVAMRHPILAGLLNPAQKNRLEMLNY